MVFLIRPRGLASVSLGSPVTSGITATPVSNPDSPSASFGKSRNAIATTITGLPPCCVSSACRQLPITSGRPSTCRMPVAITITFMPMYVQTSTTATPIASPNKPERAS